METRFIVNPIENYAAEKENRLAQCTGVTEDHFVRLMDEDDANDSFNIVKGEGATKKLAHGHYREATPAEIKVVTDGMAKAVADVRRKARHQELLDQEADQRIDRMISATEAEAGLKKR